MNRDELKVSVTVRIPVSMINMLDKLVDEKKFRDRSEAIRTLVHDGTYLNKIIMMVQDPKKVKDIVKKLKSSEALKDIEHTLETMEPHELQVVQKLAVNIRDLKTRQTFLDMKV